MSEIEHELQQIIGGSHPMLQQHSAFFTFVPFFILYACFFYNSQYSFICMISTMQEKQKKIDFNNSTERVDTRKVKQNFFLTLNQRRFYKCAIICLLFRIKMLLGFPDAEGGDTEEAYDPSKLIREQNRKVVN